MLRSPTALGSLSLAVLLQAHGAAQAPSRADAPLPHVLLISIDTLRSDHLGCYGYPRATSPHIDELSKRGTLFENACSTASWTLPSHASLMTGTYPARHGVRDDGNRLRPDLPTLAERLQELGYWTCGAVSGVYVTRTFGFERGFERFDEALARDSRQKNVATGIVDRLLEQIDARPAGAPFFAFAHVFDPHFDYRPPSPYRERFVDPAYDGELDGTLGSMAPYLDAGPMREADRQHLIDLYDGEIAYVDAEIGRLLAALEEREVLADTVVVVTADHGEEFKEHGALGHAKTLYNEQLAIPLIIAGTPRFPPGQRHAAPVSLVDVAPTILALVRGGAADGFDGVPLDAPVDPARAVFADGIRLGDDLRAARLGIYKAIEEVAGERRSFFDLGRDPGELAPRPEDPSGGAVTSALASYALLLDTGWHIALVARDVDGIAFRGRVSTTGRIVDPRPYFSDRMMGSAVRIERCEATADGHELHFDIKLARLMGEIAFRTEPADAEIRLEIRSLTRGGWSRPAVYLGRAAVRADAGEVVTLAPNDPRLIGMPAEPAAGVHVRAVPAAAQIAPPSDLSEEEIRALHELGYTGAGGGKQPEKDKD